VYLSLYPNESYFARAAVAAGAVDSDSEAGSGGQAAAAADPGRGRHPGRGHARAGCGTVTVTVTRRSTVTPRPVCGTVTPASRTRDRDRDGRQPEGSTGNFGTSGVTQGRRRLSQARRAACGGRHLVESAGKSSNGPVPSMSHMMMSWSSS
jgi:hypothetical protein